MAIKKTLHIKFKIELHEPHTSKGVVKCLKTEEIQGQFSALWVYYINNLISGCKYYVTNILNDFFLKMIFRPCYLLFGKTSI